jgi:hypothetical protein
MGRFLLCHQQPFSVSKFDVHGRVWFHRQHEAPDAEAYSGCQTTPERLRILAGFGQMVAFARNGRGSVAWRCETPEAATSLDRTPAGNYLLGLFEEQEVREISPAGEILRKLELPGKPSDARVLSPDRLLVCFEETREVMEVEFDGRIVWRIVSVVSPTSARRLSSGGTLIASPIAPSAESGRLHAEEECCDYLYASPYRTSSCRPSRGSERRQR